MAKKCLCRTAEKNCLLRSGQKKIVFIQMVLPLYNHMWLVLLFMLQCQTSDIHVLRFIKYTLDHEILEAQNKNVKSVTLLSRNYVKYYL